jgi:hypothetical protein
VREAGGRLAMAEQIPANVVALARETQLAATSAA